MDAQINGCPHGRARWCVRVTYDPDGEVSAVNFEQVGPGLLVPDEMTVLPIPESLEKRLDVLLPNFNPDMTDFEGDQDAAIRLLLLAVAQHVRRVTMAEMTDATGLSEFTTGCDGIAAAEPQPDYEPIDRQ